MDTNRLAESVQIISRAFHGCRPACGLILGSGWETVVKAFTVKDRLSYARLPALGKTSIAGHAGILFLAEQSGIRTLIFQGRHHWYEGLGWEPIALPIYALKRLGASLVVLTNSAGGIRSGLKAGGLMTIKDHINAMGVNPLQGEHSASWGERFVDQTAVYDLRLRSLLKQTARRHHLRLKEGVYMGVTGPVYETPAEIRAFKKMGADAVGMSTVPEAILANAAGLRVVGLSLVANSAAGVGNQPLEHSLVLKTGQGAKEKMKVLLEGFWRAMAKARVL